MLRTKRVVAACYWTAVCLAMAGAGQGDLRATAADREEPPRRRAAPPDWSSDVLDAFFRDAREQLVGERPQAGARQTNDRSRPGPAPQARTTGDEKAWSAWIDEAALTTEVKRIHHGLRSPLANPSKFKAGGYLPCRRDYSLLAVLMAIIAEHPDRVRWHDQASLLAKRFQAAAEACKTADDESYAAASAAKIDLEEIIRGGRLAGEAPEDSPPWPELAERRYLMQRMETALEKRIQGAVANAATLRREADQVAHEAQLVAALGEVICRSPYEYADDADFVAMANDLRDAAQTLTQAARDRDHEAAVAAVSRITQSCSDCHAGYR